MQSATTEPCDHIHTITCCFFCCGCLLLVRFFNSILCCLWWIQNGHSYHQVRLIRLLLGSTSSALSKTSKHQAGRVICILNKAATFITAAILLLSYSSPMHFSFVDNNRIFFKLFLNYCCFA